MFAIFFPSTVPSSLSNFRLETTLACSLRDIFWPVPPSLSPHPRFASTGYDLSLHNISGLIRTPSLDQSIKSLPVLPANVFCFVTVINSYTSIGSPPVLSPEPLSLPDFLYFPSPEPVIFISEVTPPQDLPFFPPSLPGVSNSVLLSRFLRDRVFGLP